MEKINKKELKDETIYPDEQVLKAILGKSYNAFYELLKLYDHNEMVYEWKYYNDAKAWLCKVQKKKRTIVWMSAWKGYMLATIYIPGKYIRQIYKLNLSEEAKEIIRKTKNVGKSKPCIFKIRSRKNLKDFNEVMQFKLTAK
jgi:hypothetical protein